MFQKYIYKMLVAVHVVFAVVMVMILIQYPNMYNIDFAGHVASCRFFDIYGLHAVNLQWFLGYVTNLFYPPLEDMLCASVHRVTGWGYIQSFQLYISVISMLYVYLGCRLTRHRDDYVIKSLWLVLRFGYIWMYKAGLIYMQGMGMMDAAFTGLTSQILGGCFLLWLIDWMLSHPSPVGEGIEGEVITTKQSITPILSLIGIILSHLVLAPIGVGLYSLSMILSRQYRKLMVHLGIVVVATVWRWLPFVVYKSTMASSTIIKDVPVYIGLVVVGLVGMVFFLSTNPSQSSLCQGRGGMVTLVALITITLGILMPSYIYMILGTNYLPAFHYYRFLSPGLLLGLIACMSMLSSMAISKKYIYTLGAVIAGGFFWSFDVITPMHLAGYIHEGQTDIKPYETTYTSSLTGGARTWLIDTKRPIDFQSDSVIQSQTDMMSIKGLFWESSQSNTLVSSYLATILKDDSIVLNYRLWTPLSCEQRIGFIDHMIKDYTIREVIVPRDMTSIRYLSGDVIQCLQSWITLGDTHWQLSPTADIYIAGNPYTTYSLTPRTGVQYDVIQPIASGSHISLLASPRDDDYFFNTVINDVMKHALSGTVNESYYLWKPQYDTYMARSGQYIYDAPISWSLSGSIYTIQSPQFAGIYPFVIRLAGLPGWVLLDDEGRELPLYQGLHQMIGVSHGGTVKLIFRGPWRRWWGRVMPDSMSVF